MDGTPATHLIIPIRDDQPANLATNLVNNSSRVYCGDSSPLGRVPSILKVCQNSRMIALKHLTRMRIRMAKHTGGSRAAYLNTSHDTFIWEINTGTTTKC